MKSNSDSSGSGIGSKIVGTLFFSVFLIGGVVAFYFISKMVRDNYATYTWKKHRCQILENSFWHDPGSDNPYGVKIRYRYEWNGNSRVSRDFSVSEPKFSKYAKAYAIERDYPVGSEQACWVNAENPSEAVLKRGNLWSIFILLLPLIFVLIGGGGIYAMLFYKDDNSRSRGKSKSKSAGGRGAKIFGAIFLLIGLAIFVPLFGLPSWYMLDSQGWQEQSCTVIYSRVKSHDSDDGTTYSVEVFYRYEFGGREYKSDRYGFIGGSSSGYSSKAKVVREMPAGKAVRCYVDPNDPAQAVIKRGFTWELLIGLIPLFFIIAGLAVMIYGGGSSKQSKGRQELARPDTGPTVLKPKLGRKGRLAGVIFAALFWNGIVSVFLYQAVEGWIKGDPSWFLTLFLVPFVLVGLILIFAIFHSALALFNPMPVLELSTSVFNLGERARLNWTVQGKFRKLQSFTIELIGQEQATYRRGTDTVTVTEEFERRKLVDIPGRLGMPSGEAELFIPKSSMHSFDASNNKIVWMLKVSGEIPRWPDVGLEYALEVLPLEVITKEVL